MTARRISTWFAPALLALSSTLLAWNWYLQPQRALAWAAAALVLGAMALALVLAARRPLNEADAGSAGSSIRSGVVFAGLILTLSLSMKLAGTFGAMVGADLSQRAMMVVLGAFFAVTGNSLPKRLTPLAAQRCDGARVQAFQRYAGWTWVLTGLSFAMAWLVLPVAVANPVSLALLLSGTLLIAGKLVGLRRTRVPNGI